MIDLLYQVDFRFFFRNTKAIDIKFYKLYGKCIKLFIVENIRSLQRIWISVLWFFTVLKSYADVTTFDVDVKTCNMY